MLRTMRYVIYELDKHGPRTLQQITEGKKRSCIQTPRQETYRHFFLDCAVVFELEVTAAGRFFVWLGCGGGRCGVELDFPAPGVLPGDRARYRISSSFILKALKSDQVSETILLVRGKEKTKTYAAISGSSSSSLEISPPEPPSESESIWPLVSVVSAPPLALALVPGTALKIEMVAIRQNGGRSASKTGIYPVLTESAT